MPEASTIRWHTSRQDAALSRRRTMAPFICIFFLACNSFQIVILILLVNFGLHFRQNRILIVVSNCCFFLSCNYRMKQVDAQIFLVLLDWAAPGMALPKSRLPWIPTKKLKSVQQFISILKYLHCPIVESSTGGEESHHEGVNQQHSQGVKKSKRRSGKNAFWRFRPKNFK